MFYSRGTRACKREQLDKFWNNWISGLPMLIYLTETFAPIHLPASLTKSRDYKERQVDRKKRKVFVTAHVVLRTTVMFLASALNKGSHPPEILINWVLIPGGNASVLSLIKFAAKCRRERINITMLRPAVTRKTAV